MCGSRVDMGGRVNEGSEGMLGASASITMRADLAVE